MNLAISYAMEMIASALAPLKKSVEPMPWAEVILDGEIFECVRIRKLSCFFCAIGVSRILEYDIIHRIGRRTAQNKKIRQ